MFADAVAYGIALSAFNRGTAFEARAAMASGGVLLTLSISVLVDAIRRVVFGSDPKSRIMIGVASISLLVNATVLYLLGTYRDQGLHLRATWIFTRVDVITNLAVILSGLTILLTGFCLVDLIVGALLGCMSLRKGLRSSAKRGRLAKGHSDHNRIGSRHLTVKNSRVLLFFPFASTYRTKAFWLFSFYV
jgi:Co/Zn/Cd efflux system component